MIQAGQSEAVRLFVLIQQIQQTDQPSAQPAPEQRVGETDLSFPVQGDISIVPDLIILIPAGAAGQLDGGYPCGSQHGFFCQTPGPFADCVCQQCRGSACDGHRVMRPSAIHQFKQRIADGT